MLRLYALRFTGSARSLLLLLLLLLTQTLQFLQQLLRSFYLLLIRRGLFRGSGHLDLRLGRFDNGLRSNNGFIVILFDLRGIRLARGLLRSGRGAFKRAPMRAQHNLLNVSRVVDRAHQNVVVARSG